ncbi:hypothetical protein NOR_04278 [Metarhizium rileyi]|uniref:Uncharacterized protein n=1 Tax=Metarhizium rileyi (strain RCEF 4871) TaxID=1649241 RepID=A0A162JLD3_METRR|nr:hypothetical protein NOR_04278 [Metarhizium rileyi RCEF 4871]
MTAAQMEDSVISTSCHSDTSDSIFSSTLQAVLSALFKSRFPDSIEDSPPTGSASAASNDTFFSLPSESQHEENTPQALIDIINGILGPIEASTSVVQDGHQANSADGDEPVPNPPPSPPRTPPPFWPQPRPHLQSDKIETEVWDMVSDEEEVKEAGWERL